MMLTHCGNNVRNRYSGCVFSVKDIVPVPLKTSRNLFDRFFISVIRNTESQSLRNGNLYLCYLGGREFSMMAYGLKVLADLFAFPPAERDHGRSPKNIHF